MNINKLVLFYFIFSSFLVEQQTNKKNFFLFTKINLQFFSIKQEKSERKKIENQPNDLSYLKDIQQKKFFFKIMFFLYK